MADGPVSHDRRMDQRALLITAMDVYGLPDALKQAWHVIVGQ